MIRIALITLFGLVGCCGRLCTATAEERPQVELWPGQVPALPEGEKPEIVVKEDDRIGHRVLKVTKPMITVYRPAEEKNTGACVVVCPGGGYNILAIDHEGVDVCIWLNKIGVTGVLLHYRVPRVKDLPKHAAPLMDAQRAIRVTRQHAKEWQIAPNRVGVLGFSAGGHLTVATGTNYDRSDYPKVDAADELSCRPDFLIPIYPAYLTDDYRGDSLKLADEIRVDKNTPPSIMIHATDDGVSATNSVAFYLALKKAGVATELHIYPSGGHGYGIRKTNHAVSTWPKRVEQWLRSRDIID